MKLKIGTYNVCHCANFEEWKEQDFVANVDVNKTANAIKRLNLDIIGLNEVYSEGENKEYFNQTERLAQLAGYKYCAFALGEKFSWTTIGNAILSRYPIVNTHSVIAKKPDQKDRAIENAKWWEDRVVLSADIDVNGQTIKVIETHFGLNLIEQQNVVKVVCKLIDDSSYPVILMGDFNVLPDDPVLNDIYDRLFSATIVMDKKVKTFSSYKPTEQIDYIFFSKSMSLNSCDVHEILTSDHMPLTANITIE